MTSDLIVGQFSLQEKIENETYKRKIESDNLKNMFDVNFVNPNNRFD